MYDPLPKMLLPAHLPTPAFTTHHCSHTITVPVQPHNFRSGVKHKLTRPINSPRFVEPSESASLFSRSSTDFVSTQGYDWYPVKDVDLAMMAASAHDLYLDIAPALPLASSARSNPKPNSGGLQGVGFYNFGRRSLGVKSLYEESV